MLVLHMRADEETAGGEEEWTGVKSNQLVDWFVYTLLLSLFEMQIIFFLCETRLKKTFLS